MSDSGLDNTVSRTPEQARADLERKDRTIEEAVERFGRAVRDEAWEVAAKEIDAETKRILGLQKPTSDPLSTDWDVNHNLRMMAVMLPDCAKKIRSLIPEQKDGIAARQAALGEEE